MTVQAASAITTTYFNLPNLRLHAAVAGPEKGPLVILLHGFPEFWYSWRHTIGPLAQAGFRVVAPDQRGYNLSEKKGPYHIHTLVEDVVQLMQACGHENAYVVGHDWGAAVAWALAAIHPGRVGRLTILNVPHPVTMMRALRALHPRQLRKSWYIFYFQLPFAPEVALRQNDFRNLKRMMRGSARKGTFSDADLAQYAEAWAQPGALTGMLNWYRAMFRFGLNPGNDRSLTRRLPMPTLILWGERDVALEVELAEQSLSWLANGRLIRYPEATHWIHEDLPEDVNQQIVAHLTA